MLHIHGHLIPVVDAADGFPGVRRPGLVAGLAGMRDGVELPDQLAGADVVGVDVGGVGIVVGAARGQRDDDQVLEDAARVAGLQCAGSLAIQAGAQIGAAVVSKALDSLAGARVDGCEIACVDVQQTPVGAVLILPIVDSARANSTRVGVNPQLLAGSGVQRDKRIILCQRVNHPVDDNRVENIVAALAS